MSVLMAVAITLYTVIAISFGMNIGQVFKESRELKARGKTPLVGKNLATVTIAMVAEVLTIFLVTLIAEPFFSPTVTYVVLSFSVAYFLKTVAAYLTAWGIWALFINLEKRKMQKQVEKDQEEAVQ